jgi:hypothetical protein
MASKIPQKCSIWTG